MITRAKAQTSPQDILYDAHCYRRKWSKLDREVVFVSSLAMNTPQKETRDWTVIETSAWTLKMYEKVCEDEEFYDSVKANLIESDEIKGKAIKATRLKIRKKKK